MEKEEQVVTPQGEQEPAPEPKKEESVPEFTVESLKEQLAKETEARRQLTARATKAEADKKALEVRFNNLPKGEKAALEVNDFIDISASLEGLDRREKEYLAQQHKLTGKSLSEIRKDENFLLWQSAYKQKVERESKNIVPSGTQPDADAPISLEQALAEARTIQEKEDLLREHAGYSVSGKRRADTVIIGRTK